MLPLSPIPTPICCFCHRSQVCGPRGPPRARVRVRKGRRGLSDALPSSSDVKSQPHTGSRMSMANSPAPERRQDEARAVSPPGPKALLVACVFPPVPKSEDLVVIRRHLSGVGWGVQPRSKHWTCELQPTRCGLREAARGLLTENASQGSGSELEEAK